MKHTVKYEKFYAKVEVTGFCWHWRGSLNENGYGMSYLGGGRQLAHRRMYELLVGPIPEGLTLDHLCRIRFCVNPDHLEPVTLLENLARAKRFRNLAHTHTRAHKAKRLAGHCRKGHELTPDNVLLSARPSGIVRKKCKACQHAAQEAHRRNKGLPERGRRGAYGPRMALQQGPLAAVA